MRALSFRNRLKEELAKAAAAEAADPWRLTLERARGKSATMASSALLRSCCSISLRSRNTVEEPALAGVWRSSWPNWGGWLCGSAVLRAAGIWSKFAGIAANQSVTHDQQVAPTDHVDLFLPTNSKKVKR